jgi:hypothetical protein
MVSVSGPARSTKLDCAIFGSPSRLARKNSYMLLTSKLFLSTPPSPEWLTAFSYSTTRGSTPVSSYFAA